MPKDNPAGYLKKPKKPKIGPIKRKPLGEAKTTKDLKARLKERRKKAKENRYLSAIEGN